MTIFLKLLLGSNRSRFLFIFLLIFSCSTAPSYKDFYNEAIDESKRGNNLQAILNYKKSLSLKPNFYKARYNLTLTLLEEENWEESKENIDYLRDHLSSDNIYLLKIEAYYFFKKGELEESFIIYNRLKEFLPLDIEILYNLSYLNIVNQNNLREAYQLLQKINQVDPNFKGLEASWVKALGFSF